jgi:hypothetical protein
MSIAPINNDNFITYRFFSKTINLKLSTVRTAFIVSGFITLFLISCSYFIYTSPNIPLHYTISAIQLIGMVTLIESTRILNHIFKFINN